MSDPLEDEVAYRTRKAEALQLLHLGDARRAFDLFRWTVWYRAGVGPIDGKRLADALGALSAMVVAMGHRELATALAGASVDPGPESMYSAGYELIEAGLPAIAATVLGHCLVLSPGKEQVVTELVAALERLLLYGEARRVLEAQPTLLGESFLCRYLCAFDAAMSGDLARTRELAPGLAPADATQQYMATRIAALLARADRIAAVTPLDDRDLAGWHQVVTGGILLHRSPFGFDEGMRGRYAWLQDSFARVKTGIERLARVLEAWGAAPECIYPPPGRDHEIVAAVASRRLGLPVAPWPAVGVPAPGLVCAYDLADVVWKDLERLQDRRAGQILYAHAGGWTDDGPVAPDVVMLLRQRATPPWVGQLRVVPGGGDMEQTSPDERPADDIAAEIVAGPGLEADDAARDDPAALEALVAAAGAPAPGRRERLWAGSPVASNRFE